MSLEGRVAVVTGAGRREGIGAAVARDLLRRGATVVLSDLEAAMDTHPDYESSSSSELQQNVNELRDLGGDVAGIACDVRDAEQVQGLVDETVARFGQIDVLINNAGVAVGLDPVVELDERDWRLNLDVMCTGVFLCSRAAARHMIQAGQGGRIINMSSQAGKTGMPLLAAYCAAKFAVIGFTQSLAQELGTYGITVNAVCPGTVMTPMLEVSGGLFERYPEYLGIDRERYKRGLLRQIPLGRFADPNDIASVVAFLASDRADYITGEAVNVTGGQEMH